MTAISVVMPCRNAGRFIGPAIASALRQTLAPSEVLVIDDGSTDDSVAVAESFGNPVRVLRTDHGNAASARADGAAEAAADLMLFLDADDLLGSHALEALAGAVPAGGIAHCDWRRYEAIAEGVWGSRPPSSAPRPAWQDELSGWLTGWYCPPCGVLWSREALDQAGGWRRGRYCNQDGDVMMRALARAVPIRKAAFGEVFYRRSPGETVSARRLDREGIAARLDILGEVSGILEEQGSLRRYRRALAFAFDAVRRDAVAHGHTLGAERVDARVLGGGGARLRAVGGRLGRRWSRMPIQPPARPAGRPTRPGSFMSVIIPTFERPAATLRAVSSVLSQTHRDLEVIVVDDASSDDTVERLDLLDDARLRVLRQPENGGVARARNRGIAGAKGDVIAFLDSDDAWRPEKAAATLEALSNGGASAGIASCGARSIHPDGMIVDRHANADGWRLEDLLLRNILPGGGSAVAVTRRVVETIGGFDPSLPAIEDWEYWIRASRFFSVVVVPDPLVLYDESDDAGRRSRRMRANMDGRRMLFDRYRDELRQTGQAQRFLMESARRELTEHGGRPAEGRRLVTQALGEAPSNWRVYPWLPYMLLPDAAREKLRRIDARSEPREI